MNEIPIRQNEQKQLERLAAMRELYSSAKNWHGFQIIITTLIPVILAIVSLVDDSFSVSAAIMGLAVFLLDIYFLDSSITSRKEKAAKIQEMFDCDILKIPKSKFKIVDTPTVEEVLNHYNAFIKIPSDIEKIKNWYFKGVDPLPLSIARILCQRTNCWWDSNLRKNYSIFLNLITIIIFLLVFTICLFSEKELLNTVLIYSALVPFFQFCIKQRDDNIEAANRLKEMVDFSIDLWTQALDHISDGNKCSDEVLLVESRRLQDEIFLHRSKSPLIFDFYYKFFRDKHETLMNQTGKHLVEEVISLNKSNFNHG